MSAAQDVCRCLSPEEWRDGLCGYCGRAQRILYAPHEAELTLTLHAQIVAREQQQQRTLADALRGVAEAVARMPGGEFTVTMESLSYLFGLTVRVDERSRTVQFAGPAPGVPQPPLEPPVYVG